MKTPCTKVQGVFYVRARQLNYSARTFSSTRLFVVTTEEAVKPLATLHEYQRGPSSLQAFPQTPCGHDP